MKNSELVLYLLSCFLLHLLSSLKQSSAYAYTPIYNFAVDCGAAGLQTDPDGRSWTGDDSKYAPTNGQKSISATASNQPDARVPYYTARVSSSPFSYSFPVTSGRTFIRLHFYPADYSKFNRSSSFFNVTAGDFTLLSNFSASLTADYLKQDVLAKEFCLNIDQESQKLNITLIPFPNSYAFVNGIEVVSMPTNLYYTGDDINYIGVDNTYQLYTNSALETMYRLNVGGRQIPANNDDTGMFRSWDNDDDSHGPFLVSKPGVVPLNLAIQLKYSKIPNYTAPGEVYRTARTMGTNGTENMMYNLTWALEVDTGFTYFVRLHFCEFQPEIQAINDRQFKIYIANQTAEEQADVIVWSSGNGIPVYRDYAVTINNENSKPKTNLLIALHPGQKGTTRFPDAILNGLELFKISDSDNNLAAPNPNPNPMFSPPNQEPQNQKHHNGGKGIGIIIGGIVAGVVIIALLGFLVFWRRMRRFKDAASSDTASWKGPFSFGAIKSTKPKASDSHLPSDLCRYFSLAETKSATSDFDQVFIVGTGGFGNVYKGYIEIGGHSTPVAIKRLNPGSQQGAHEFKTEIEMLSQLRHLHLVSLIGYCNEDREMILVYDYMERGTLRDHLYGTDNPPLSWKRRLEICIGAARGLLYLHTGAKQTIIHRDVKATNILLNEKWVAKVSDFGLSKMGPTNAAQTHVSTVVKGSMGYLDPEYYKRQKLTEKSDVYSFGVVLMEVLCARPVLDKKLDKKQVSLAQWARYNYKNGTLDEIVDFKLDNQIAPECLKKYAEIADSCLNDDGTKRPSMGDVVWGLEFALKLQESAEERIKTGGAHKEKHEDIPIDDSLMDGGDLFSDSIVRALKSPIYTTTTSRSEQDSSTTNTTSFGSENFVSGAVFSEIGKSEGR